MKKIFLFMMAALAAVACEQFEDVKSVDRIGEISVGIQISLDKGDDVPSPASYKVKLNNYAENIEMVQEVKAGDVVELKDIIPGIYTIAVSGESSANGFTYVFNGNLSNVNVTEDGKRFS